MHRPAVLISVIITALSLLLAGCSKNEEPVQVPTMSPASQQPASEASKAPSEESQMSRALAIHKEFVASFSETLSSGDTVEALRARMDLADKARLNSMMLRSDLSDAQAAEFLVRFTDLLQRYLDLGSRHIATLEEVNRLHSQGKEMQDRIATLPDKEKAQATKEFNAIVDQHNDMVKGPLAQEREELEALGKGLLELG